MAARVVLSMDLATLRKSIADRGQLDAARVLWIVHENARATRGWARADLAGRPADRALLRAWLAEESHALQALLRVQAALKNLGWPTSVQPQVMTARPLGWVASFDPAAPPANALGGAT